MHVKAAGSVFLALLVLFPVAAQESSPRCVTYKHKQTCGLKGRSVDFPCSYPKDVGEIQMKRWSRKTDKDKKLKLKQISSYSSPIQYVERGNSDCTLKLTDLKKSDESTYYFMYNVRNKTGHGFTCGGDPGVRLHVFVFAVKIHVETRVRGQNLSAVTAGQRITLTCVPTCPSSLNSSLGYIWYKNQQPLSEQKGNSPVLSLDPDGNEHTGSYVCAIMGLEDLRSSPFNIPVPKTPTDTASLLATTPAKDSVSTLSFDSQNSTDQRFNNDQTPTNKSLLKVSVTLVTSVCIGFAMGMSLTVLVFKLKCKDKKKKKKRRGCDSSGCRRPDPNSDFYSSLGVSSMFSEYETLDAVKHCSTAETDYENLELRNVMK